mgnify:CR=1 FL=1
MVWPESVDAAKACHEQAWRVGMERRRLRRRAPARLGPGGRDAGRHRLCELRPCAARSRTPREFSSPRRVERRRFEQQNGDFLANPMTTSCFHGRNLEVCGEWPRSNERIECVESPIVFCLPFAHGLRPGKARQGDIHASMILHPQIKIRNALPRCPHQPPATLG